MSGATTTTGAEAIAQIFQIGLQKTFNEGTPLLNLYGWVPYKGGNATEWKLNYAGNAGALYDEGDTPPAAGSQSYADMSEGFFSAWNTVKVTGHLKDAMKGGYFDAVAEEMAGGMSGLMRRVEQKAMTKYEAAINDDTTYAGQTRATVNADSYVVEAGSSSLTLAMMSEWYEALTLDPRGVEYDNDWVITSAPEQRTAYTEIATGVIFSGDEETTGPHLPFGSSQMDPKIDAGRQRKTILYNDIPWWTLSTHTNTLIFATRKSDVLIEEVRPLTVEPLGKTEDADEYLITWRGNLTHKSPYHAARVEALTT